MCLLGNHRKHIVYEKDKSFEGNNKLFTAICGNGNAFNHCLPPRLTSNTGDNRKLHQHFYFPWPLAVFPSTWARMNEGCTPSLAP